MYLHHAEVKPDRGPKPPPSPDWVPPRSAASPSGSVPSTLPVRRVEQPPQPSPSGRSCRSGSVVTSQLRATGRGAQSSASPDVQFTWTRTDRLLAVAAAWSLFGVGLLYIVVTTTGFVVAGGLQTPILDPVFALMELLILVEAPLIVLLFVAVHRYAVPTRRTFSLAALSPTIAMAWLTLGVHFLLLTVGRQVDPSLIPGFDYLFTFKWPSVVYALDIVAWDFSFGLVLLAAAPVFTGPAVHRAVRMAWSWPASCAWRACRGWSPRTCRSATSVSSATRSCFPRSAC